MVTGTRRFRRRCIESSWRISGQKLKLPHYTELTGRYTCPSDRHRNNKKNSSVENLFLIT